MEVSTSVDWLHKMLWPVTCGPLAVIAHSWSRLTAIDGFENSNKNLCLSHSQISFRNKTIVFKKQLIKKTFAGRLHIVTT